MYCGIFAQSKNCGARETTFICRQRLGKDAPATTDMHATIEVLLETVFYNRSCKVVIRKTNGATESVGREQPFREHLIPKAEE
jgi:hypothetical protein